MIVAAPTACPNPPGKSEVRPSSGWKWSPRPNFFLPTEIHAVTTELRPTNEHPVAGYWMETTVHRRRWHGPRVENRLGTAVGSFRTWARLFEIGQPISKQPPYILQRPTEAHRARDALVRPPCHFRLYPARSRHQSLHALPNRRGYRRRTVLSWKLAKHRGRQEQLPRKRTI